MFGDRGSSSSHITAASGGPHLGSSTAPANVTPSHAAAGPTAAFADHRKWIILTFLHSYISRSRVFLVPYMLCSTWPV